MSLKLSVFYSERGHKKDCIYEMNENCYSGDDDQESTSSDGLSTPESSDSDEPSSEQDEESSPDEESSESSDDDDSSLPDDSPPDSPIDSPPESDDDMDYPPPVEKEREEAGVVAEANGSNNIRLLNGMAYLLLPFTSTVFCTFRIFCKSVQCI